MSRKLNKIWFIKHDKLSLLICLGLYWITPYSSIASDLNLSGYLKDLSLFPQRISLMNDLAQIIHPPSAKRIFICLSIPSKNAAPFLLKANELNLNEDQRKKKTVIKFKCFYAICFYASKMFCYSNKALLLIINSAQIQ